MSRTLRGWKCTHRNAAGVIGVAGFALAVFAVACGLESGGAGAPPSDPPPSGGDAGIDAKPSDDGGVEASGPQTCKSGSEHGCPDCTEFDDGICKDGLRFSEGSPGPVLGVTASGSGSFIEPTRVELGRALVGFSGRSSLSYAETIKIHTAPLRLRRDVVNGEFQYSVTWKKGDAQEVGSTHGKGGGGTTEVKVDCDPPKVIVGMDVLARDDVGSGNDGLAHVDFLCAEIRITGKPNAWTFTLGEPVKLGYGDGILGDAEHSPPVLAPALLLWSGMTGFPASDNAGRLENLGGLTQKIDVNPLP